MEGGGKEMIDAPMLKQASGLRLFRDWIMSVIQAENIIRLARAAGCDIPHVE